MGDAVKKLGRKTLLTPQVQEKIVAYIRGGSFAWVAAAAAGITQSSYFRWMMRGEEEYKAWERACEEQEENDPDAQAPPEMSQFAAFWYAVYEARGQARVFIENKVSQERPLEWLRYGPGRHKPGEEGWTDSTKIELTGANGTPLNALEQIDLSGLNEEELIQYEALMRKCIAGKDAGGDPS